MRNTESSNTAERTPVRLGRYEIVQKLGVGGMADVYLAHRPGPFLTSKLIVIKQLRSGMLDGEQFVQMFADESRIALRLSHPNVVQTYEAVAEGEDFYLVLEFLDGKSLYQVLNQVKRAQMPLALHLWILSQTLAGLHYAHELKEYDDSSMGIVHRDVSPSNVFVTHSGEVKLLDFGIAKSIGASTATREGIIKGKLGYAAPEQCLCKAIDRRTDLFAVGVMLWEAIAGRRRPMGETDASTYQARIQGTELRIEQAAPTAPAALVAICNRAIAHNPDERYQSALEFRQAIERYLLSSGWDNGAEQLCSFMHEHFSADIDAMRRHIDEYFGRSRSSGTNRSAPIAQVSLSPSTYLSVEGTNEQVQAAASVRPWIERRWGRLALFTSGALTVAFLGWLGSRSVSTPQAHSVVASSRASAGAKAPSVPTMQTVAQPVAPPAAPITVVISAKPDRAQLRLDGRQISNPYRAAHSPDNAHHHLTMACTGYETFEEDVSFDRNLDLAIVLREQPQRSRSVMRAPRVASARSTIQRIDTTPAAATPEPGDTLRSAKKSGQIDEADPY